MNVINNDNAFFQNTIDVTRYRLISERSNNFFEKNDLLKVFPVPGNFGGLWYTTWQLCCGNNSNDIGIGLDI